MTIKHKQKFDTSRMIVLGSIIMTAWLLLSGIFASDSFAMSFANIGMVHTLIRAGVLIALIAIFVSSPPRSTIFRLLLGATSTAVLIVSFALMADYSIGILDALLYLLVSIVLALEALEFERKPASKRAIALSSSSTSAY